MYTPIREINNELGRNRFFVFSKRLQREVRLYNKLHYDHWALIETDLTVVDYCERPHKIVVSVAGEIIETTFDMWIKTNTSEHFLFIKYSYEMDSDDKRAKPKTIKELLAQQLWCKDRNKEHRVVTQEDVRGNPILLANKKLLIPFYTPMSELKDKLYYSIINRTSEQPINIRHLESSFQLEHDSATIRNKIYAMIFHNILLFNADCEVISSQTEVTLNVEKAHR
jgi:hypothetical protein